MYAKLDTWDVIAKLKGIFAKAILVKMEVFALIKTKIIIALVLRDLLGLIVNLLVPLVIVLLVAMAVLALIPEMERNLLVYVRLVRLVKHVNKILETNVHTILVNMDIVSVSFFPCQLIRFVKYAIFW